MSAGPCTLLNCFGPFEAYGSAATLAEAWETFHSFESLQTLLRMLALRTVDAVEEICLVEPGHPLNHLGAGCRGVGFALVLGQDDGNQIRVGVAPRHWVFIGANGEPEPGGDCEDEGWLLYWFEEWTELPARGSFSQELGAQRLRHWFETGRLSG